ncbi:MAG: DNA cytosine methyltransferase [Oscillospiraceae bacterium]|nr:DNA cytosine methyltransferase [Oscillospiraceae bacterium]MCL2278121.1 DNA cytosine methyltransferase [Oscillospiraceae bacterium]
MNKCIVYGILNDEKYRKLHDITRRVYDPTGISPTIHTVGGGNQEVKIVVWGGLQEHQTPRTDGVCPTINAASGMGGGHTPIVSEPTIAAVRGREPAVLTTKRTEYGKKIRKDYEAGNVKEPRKHIQQLEPRDDGLCGTITTVTKDNYLVEPSGLYTNDTDEFHRGTSPGISRAIKANKHDAAVLYGEPAGTYVGKPQYAEKKPLEGMSRAILTDSSSAVLIPQREYDEDGNRTVTHKKSDIAPAILATQHKSGDNQSKVLENEPSQLRIRKLTAKECLKLMDFDAEDYDKMKAAGISESRIYQAAGDSIVVSVLEHIFRQMIPMEK